jgi:hypothetical protein
MFVNKTRYEIIDIDINKHLFESEIKEIREMIIEKIEETQDKINGKLPRIVITGNGGLHLYSILDNSIPVKHGRTCHVFENMEAKLKFDIDIFTPIDPEKRSLLILPDSKIIGAIDNKIKKYQL